MSGRHAQLLHAVRIVIRADADPARQALFENLRQSRIWVRFACALHDRLRGTPGWMLVIGGYGLLAYLGIAPARNRRAQVLAVALHENARHQVHRVCDWVGRGDCDLLRSGVRVLASPSIVVRLARLLSGGHVAAALRIARAIDRRYGMMVASRAIGAIAWYARTTAILRDGRPGAVLVSSDSNPEELGFVAAARALQIPQVFVSHAYPTPLSPPLDFTLSIVEGEAAVQARSRKGPVKGRILLAGVEGESLPLDVERFTRPEPVIGIFPPKAVSWPTLAAIVDDCRRHFRARQIVIRWHPSMLQQPHLADRLSDLSGIVESARAASLGEVARQCDWVIADENSNVHLPVLKLGIPTVTVRQLGVYPPTHSDQYGFAAHGVILPPVSSIREVRPEAVRAFFDEGWARRFARYDSAYLRPAAEVGREVRCAVRGLFETAPSAAVVAE